MKQYKKVLVITSVIITIIILLFLIYMLFIFEMFSSSPTSFKEIKRISSSDSIIDAVLIKNLGNATTSPSYKLYIVPKGHKIEGSHELFIADHVIDLEINWRELKFFEIKHKQARIFKFTNFWHSDKLKNWSYVVELSLAPLTNSFSMSKMDRYIQDK